MYAANPYQQYKEQSISTLSPGELLVKLYDELIKQMRIALLSIENKDYAKVDASLSKAQTIIGTLESSLDMRFEVSKGLQELYVFFSRQLMEANIRKAPVLIEECVPLVRDLRDSFDHADRENRKQQLRAAPIGGRAV